MIFFFFISVAVSSLHLVELGNLEIYVYVSRKINKNIDDNSGIFLMSVKLYFKIPSRTASYSDCMDRTSSSFKTNTEN